MVSKEDGSTSGFRSSHGQLSAFGLSGLLTLETSVKFWGLLSVLSNVGSLFGSWDSDGQLFTALWEYVGQLVAGSKDLGVAT